MYLSKILILMSIEQLLLLFKLFRLMSKDKLCSASFMFDELSMVEGDGYLILLRRHLGSYCS